MIEAYTSYWQNPELGKVDAQIVSISRGGPRWSVPFSFRRLSELAPSDEVWREQETDGFELAYVAQLEAIGAGAILHDLERIGGGKAIVALCWERPREAFCHRWVLGRWLHERTGVEVPELEAGMLPRRHDVAEPTLFDYREDRG